MNIAVAQSNDGTTLLEAHCDFGKGISIDGSFVTTLKTFTVPRQLDISKFKNGKSFRGLKQKRSTNVVFSCVFGCGLSARY